MVIKVSMYHPAWSMLSVRVKYVNLDDLPRASLLNLR